MLVDVPWQKVFELKNKIWKIDTSRSAFHSNNCFANEFLFESSANNELVYHECINLKNDEILRKFLDESVPNYKCFSATSNESSKMKCYFCSESFRLERMRQHIDKHIINEELPINQHTFGLCGLIGCSTSLVNSLYKGSSIKKPTSYDI